MPRLVKLLRARWLELPEHIRRGLLRLYVAVSVPWIAWFGYRLLDALQRDYPRRVAEAFWSLLVVPVGVPILFLLIDWVVAGFSRVERRTGLDEVWKAFSSRSDANTKGTVPPQPTLPDYFGIGRFLVIALMDLDDCLRDVGKLGDLKVPVSVARFELAFARAAIIKNAVTKHPAPWAAAKISAGIDKTVAEAVAMKGNADTLAHYDKKNLYVIAPEVVRHYEKNASSLAKLSGTFAIRISDPNMPLTILEPLFRETADEAERLIKLCLAMEKLPA